MCPSTRAHWEFDRFSRSCTAHGSWTSDNMSRASGTGLGFIRHRCHLDFKALCAYICGRYQHCLQLCTHTMRNTIAGIDSTTLLCVYLFPELIQLMDDDIVSLLGLTTLVNRPHKRHSPPVIIYHLSLSLYLMTQCQIKLRHSVTSLARTLDYVQLAPAMITEDIDCARSADQLLLKFVEQKNWDITDVSSLGLIVVVKFEEINLKFKKVRESSRCKFEKVQKKFKIHIQSQLLSKDTQYCQHCNSVKLHAIQSTSTRFLTNAHFNNKGCTSIHKSLQKLESLKIFTAKHTII